MNKQEKWHDLSLTVSETMPVFPGDPSVRFTRFADYAKQGFMGSALNMGCHAGTHMDAPAHFVEGGDLIKQADFSRCITPAYVMAASPDEQGLITLDPSTLAELRPDEALLLATGWDCHANSADYYQRIPVFAPGSASLLIHSGIRLFGLDLPTVAEVRPASELTLTTPPTSEQVSPLAIEADQAGMHRELLNADIYLLESLAGLTSLAGRHVELIALPLKLAVAEASPVRACARILT